MSSKKEKNQQIQVFARVRPVNKQEKDARSHVVVEVPNDKEVNVRLQPNEKLSKKFTFDKVFGPNSKQLDVYSAVVKPLVAEVLAGYNCTVFAYGQTGTGKTFTMAGGSGELNGSWHSDPDVGIIPRALSQLFDELRISQMEHTVRVSYLELYNEELFDLLSLTDDSKIRLYEDATKKGSVIVHGLEEVTVHTKSEVFKILEKGSLKRQTAATLMNAQSSRSHTVFSITVHIKEANMEGGDDLLKTGKLNLVDLAGSENIGRSGAIDKRAREAGNINQSLLTLGRVITALVERTPHIPYRESKLTRLLQESLGGRTKTSIIATVSPAHCNLEETLSTLEYAYRAKNITNRPEINQKFTKNALLKQYTEEIEKLKRDLDANRRGQGVYLDFENYEHLMRDQEDKVYQINALKEELEKTESICQQLNVDLMKEKQKLEMATEKLTETSNILTNTVTKLSEKKMECNEKQHLIEKHCETEQKLGSQAKTLLSVADTLSNDTTKLHDSLFRRKMVEKNNMDKALKFQDDFQSGIENIFERVERFVTDSKTSNESISAQIADAFQSFDSHLNEMHRVVNNTVTPAFDQIALLLQTVDAQTTNLNDVSKEIRDLTQNSIKEKLQAAQNFLSSNLKSAFESFVKNTEERVMMYTTILNDFDQHVRKNTNNVYRYADDMRADFASLKLSIDSNHSVQETRLSELNGNFSQIEKMIGLMKNQTAAIQENSKTFKEDLTKKIDMKISDTDGFVQDFYEFKTGFQGSMKANIEQLMSGEKKVQEIETKIISETTKAQKDVSDVIEINNVVTSKTDSYDTKTSDFAEQFKESLKQHQETLESLLPSHGRIVENARVADGIFESDLETNLSKQIETNEHFAMSIKQGLTTNTDRVQDYINNEFVKYTPSGSTPDKRQLNYPKYLAATSPHSRILERYRASYENNTDEEPEIVPIAVPRVAAVEVVDLTIAPNCQLVKSASVNDIVSSTNSDDNTKENKLKSELSVSKFELQRSATETKIGLGSDSKLPRRAALRVKNY